MDDRDGVIAVKLYGLRRFTCSKVKYGNFLMGNRALITLIASSISVHNPENINKPNLGNHLMINSKLTITY